MTTSRNTKQTQKWMESQERFNRLWLHKRPEWPHSTICMWQDTNGIATTRIAAMECWLIGKQLFIAQFYEGGQGFEVFHQETPLVEAGPDLHKAAIHALAVCEAEAELRGVNDIDDYQGGAAGPVAEMLRKAIEKAGGINA